MFNRTYQLRSRQSGLRSAGEILQDILARAAREKKRQPRKHENQLQLNFDSVSQTSDKPLADVFPEAYE
jgi:hypothetical protein